MTKPFSNWFLVAFAVGASAACGGPSTTHQDPPPPVDPGAPPNVSVSETPVDFGLVDCGSSVSEAKVVKIANAGAGTVSWTAELESAGFDIVGARSGTFSGGGAVNVKVRANAIPASAEAGAATLATLVIVIDKAKIFRVPLRVAAQGGTLTVSPAAAVFGDLPINMQAPDIQLAIKNTGNKELSVDLAQPPLTDFAVAWTGAPATVKLAPGASIPGVAARFRPVRLSAQSTTVPLAVKGAVCGASATSIALSGKGTGGVVGISPGALDYGLINCGTQGAIKSFAILNSGTAPFTWNASLLSGRYDLSATTGIVLANNQSTVLVTPKAIPATSAITPNLYGDVLTVTTDAANDTPHVLNLTMTARGAILAFSATPADYGLQGLFAAGVNRTATVSNTGNAGANVTLTSSKAAYTLPAGPFAITAGASANTTVSFAATTFGANDATLSMATGDVVCQPLPAAANLTGQGKGIASFVNVGSRGRQGREGSSCAVITGGHVACWGDNKYGQLGTGAVSPTPATTPVVIPSFTGAVAVAGGGEHNCARTSTGTVYCWGRNTGNQGRGGQLGTAGGDKSSPTLVVGLANVISLSAAHRHTCAVSAAAAGGTNGTVYCWGQNLGANLGNGSTTDSAVPVATTITDAVSVSVSPQGGCAQRVGNSVKCWGRGNSHGQLGTGATIDNPTGAPLATDVVGVAGGTLATVALATGGGGGPNRNSGMACAIRQTTNDVACWGDNRHGKLRGGLDTFAEPTPLVMAGVAAATGITAGRQHACAIVAGGAVKCWGRGLVGQLGNGTSPDASAAVTVTGVANATQISASGFSTCAVISGGSISCWGLNDSNQLGNPAGGGSTPTVVSGF